MKIFIFEINGYMVVNLINKATITFLQTLNISFFYQHKATNKSVHHLFTHAGRIRVKFPPLQIQE